MKLSFVPALFALIISAQSGSADTIAPRPLVDSWNCFSNGADTRYSIRIITGIKGRAIVTISNMQKHLYSFELRGFGDNQDIVGHLISGVNGAEKVVGSINTAADKPDHMMGELLVDSLNGGKPITVSCTLNRLSNIRKPTPMPIPQLPYEALPDSEPAIR